MAGRPSKQALQHLDQAAKSAALAEEQGNPYPPGTLGYEALQLSRAVAELDQAVRREAARSWAGRVVLWLVDRLVALVDRRR